MKAARKTTLASRLAVPRHSDGLTGRTEAQRREIEARIEAAGRAKDRLEGRELSPCEIARAISPTRAPEKRCKSCSSKLPATKEHFPINRPGELRGTCRICFRRERARYNREYDKKPERRARKRDAERARRAALKAAGFVPVRSVLTALKDLRRTALRRLAEARSDRSREHYRTRVLNLTHEIERMAM